MNHEDKKLENGNTNNFFCLIGFVITLLKEEEDLIGDFLVKIEELISDFALKISLIR